MRHHEIVFVIEDDTLDALAVEQAFADLGAPNPMVVVATGSEALDYLHRTESNAPGLILLDLNLPGMSGMELLRHLKTDPVLKRIPVVVLSSSNEERDRHEAFDLSAAGYFVKPMNYDTFVGMIRTVITYWLSAETAR
jgi:CheY-like chemotaxis protein